MVRKQIYIERRQEKALKQLARRSGKTEAEVIRQALDEHTRNQAEREQRLAAWRELRSSMEERLNLAPVSGKRNWRREDLYDRFEHSRLGRHKSPDLSL